MFTLSIPVMLMASTYNRADIIADLRKAKADRVMLALEYLTYDAEKMKLAYDRLREEIPAYQKEGFEVGVWFWTFLVQGNPPFVPMEDVENGAFGSVNHNPIRSCCPLGEDFLRFMERHLQTVAAMHPDLILYDDDFSFRISSKASPACFCSLHRAKMEQILGEPLPDVPNLYKTMYAGKPNRLRSAFLKACGDSMVEFSARMRRAVDAIDPNVRMGQCACLTTFDADGIDSFTISKTLAGNTKPFLRLICAPYWDEMRMRGCRLVDVIELERMERSWYSGNDIEIVSEGDAYPRPRYRCPASHLELFDAALRAEGTFSGILKYMADYTSTAAYERGYFDRHYRHLPDLEAMAADFAPLAPAGVRIWETMRKLENADFSNEPNGGDLARQQLFSRATRLAAHNSIPTSYYGTGCGGICFGENARELDPAALEKPLIIDAVAARILLEKGIDTGVETFKDWFAPENERFTDTGEEICCYSGNNAFAERLTPKTGAVVKSEWSGEEKIPASFTYRNSKGQVFLVLAVNAFGSTPAYLENYERQRLVFEFFADNGNPLPAVCRKNPNLYVVCKENDDRMAIGLFNCFADEVDNLTIDLAKEWTSAGFHRCEGTLTKKQIKVDHLSAYDWCWITLFK